eukprot:TRINITY_DN4072_c0_g3_i1.p1 TRINITY_DN4072_c0_g3~~TRINITY_DN4072_c0_g3_i1.p1  ORF type:complete len:446 (+),score=137.75 TRINITY_DN4072_c0_g3_i1:117-1340(+)
MPPWQRLRNWAAGVTRTSVNQAVALTVFIALCTYAWHKDMLFRPDPAVPMRGRPPRTGEGIWLYPTQPAFFAAADGADQLQAVYDRDAATARLVRTLWLRWVQLGGDRRARYIDSGSAWGTSGLFGAALGAHSVFAEPRPAAVASVGRSARFGRVRFAHVLRNLLSDKQVLISCNASHGILSLGTPPHPRKGWVQPVDELSTSLTLPELLGGSAKAWLLHVALPGAQLAALRTAADAATTLHPSRLSAVIADFSEWTGSGPPRVDINPNATAAASTADLAQSMKSLIAAGLQLYLLPTAEGAPPCFALEQGQLRQSDLAGHPAWAVPEEAVHSVASAAVTGALRSATALHAPPTCRLFFARPALLAPVPVGPAAVSAGALLLCCGITLVTAWACCRRRRPAMGTRQN